MAFSFIIFVWFLRNFKRKIQLTSHNIKFSSTNRKIILFLYFRWILFRFDMAIVLNLRSTCFPIVNTPNEFFHDIQFYWDSKCIYETFLVLKQFNRSNLRSIHSICWNLWFLKLPIGRIQNSGLTVKLYSPLELMGCN